MAKLFVVSDIHGFFDEFKTALDAAGFDENNEDHWLIVCGDCFDRGRQPKAVLMYLQSLPRKVLIRGNHEDLLVECCERKMAHSYDFSNGTAMTIADLGDRPGRGSDFSKCCERTMDIVKPFLDSMVNYFETKRFIFVHAWVPVKVEEEPSFARAQRRNYAPLMDWRKASEKEWRQSRWLNPFEMEERGLQTDKIIICGHWHCSAGWAREERRSERGTDACFEPYGGDGFVAIDACTAHSRRVNVLVMDEHFLEEEDRPEYLYPTSGKAVVAISAVLHEVGDEDEEYRYEEL